MRGVLRFGRARRPAAAQLGRGCMHPPMGAFPTAAAGQVHEDLPQQDTCGAVEGTPHSALPEGSDPGTWPGSLGWRGMRGCSGVRRGGPSRNGGAAVRGRWVSFRSGPGWLSTAPVPGPKHAPCRSPHQRSIHTLPSRIFHLMEQGADSLLCVHIKTTPR